MTDLTKSELATILEYANHGLYVRLMETPEWQQPSKGDSDLAEMSKFVANNKLFAEHPVNKLISRTIDALMNDIYSNGRDDDDDGGVLVEAIND